METLEKKEILNELFDLYYLLLTEKQVSYFELYYKEDYSLNEIAEMNKVSRNAVFDHLKKVEEHLFFYEEKLNLLNLAKKRKEIIDEIEKTNDLKLLNELRKLDE
jgi:predicted DNA-binding protein YlxM (UPF0122 family)